MPGEEVSQAKQQLKLIIDPYLSVSEVEKVLAACDFADLAHTGITRKSGEPYILHPIAVSCILANMRLDAETLMAALLHDVIEDTQYTKEDIIEKFGLTVAELVDGVTKLSQSSDKEYNKAASFRKILQATLQDPRVIIIKLADRYHNMTTLGALRPDKRARIAQETFDIFVPMARLVGMNEMGDNLENLCYQNLDLDMFDNVQNALLQTSQNAVNIKVFGNKTSLNFCIIIIFKAVLKRKITISNYYAISLKTRWISKSLLIVMLLKLFYKALPTVTA